MGGLSYNLVGGLSPLGDGWGDCPPGVRVEGTVPLGGGMILGVVGGGLEPGMKFFEIPPCGG